MLSDNLIRLRKTRGWTQDDLAAKIRVSRQTVSKWETGESMPNLVQSKQLAELCDISLDDLVNYEGGSHALPIPPRGKHAFGLVTVGDKGQIVIPAAARRTFGLKPGDRLLLLGDEEQGLALVREDAFLEILASVRDRPDAR